MALADDVWGRTDVQDAAKGVYGRMQELANGGNEQAARDFYKQNQDKYGFTDDQFSQVAYKGNGADGSKGYFSGTDIGSWKTGASQARGGYLEPVPTAPTPPQLGFNLNDVKPAQSWNVDPKTQTVAGQLESVLASDSPLLTQARTRALQRQNANGTLNSTMATSAADSAMYDTALQIATPDARTYGDAARFNTDSANTFARDGNQFTRQGVMADFNLRANEWAAQQEFNRQLQLAEKNNAFTLARDDKNNAFTTSRDDKNNSFTTARDTANAATAAKEKATARLYGARADFTTAVNALIQNKDLGEAPKQQAIATLKTNYNTIIRQAATELGWPADSWIIKDSETAAATTPPAEGETRGTGDNGEIFAGGKWTKLKDIIN